MTQEEFAKKLIEEFPEKKTALIIHKQHFGELLGHVFFAEEINEPLIELLTKGKDYSQIKMYCTFIENMWLQGDDIVKNIIEVTILERLADDTVLWLRFGSFISKEFRRIINSEILPHLQAWLDVPLLSV